MMGIKSPELRVHDFVWYRSVWWCIFSEMEKVFFLIAKRMSPWVLNVGCPSLSFLYVA